MTIVANPDSDERTGTHAGKGPRSELKPAALISNTTTTKKRSYDTRGSMCLE